MTDGSLATPSEARQLQSSMVPFWPLERAAELIPSPTSDQDHIHNLVLLAAGADLLLEFEYRKRHPNLTHGRYLKLTNSEEFLELLRHEVASMIGISGYVEIMRAMLARAKAGNVKAAEFVLTELGVSKRLEGISVQKSETMSDFVSSMTEAMCRVMDEKRSKPKDTVIETEAEVK